MNKALGCSVGGNFVGFLVDGVRCAKVQGVLLWLSLKVLSGLPEVVVRVPGLEGGEFKWVNPGVDWKWPGKPPVGVNVFDAVAVGCAAYREEK